MPEEAKENTLQNNKKKVAWNKSWVYSGPLHISESFKDPSMEYGWVDYKMSGRLNAAQQQGWEIDRKIKTKMGDSYIPPTMDHSKPIEGALIVGSSMLVCCPKEIGNERRQYEQDSILEPQKTAKSNLESKIGANLVYGEVT